MGRFGTGGFGCGGIVNVDAGVEGVTLWQRPVSSFFSPPDNSLRPFGTVFYKARDRAAVLDGYRANRGIRAWFPKPGELELDAYPPLEFCRNRLVSYLNLPYSLHGAATDAEAPRYSMQNYCDLPLRITVPLFDGWTDAVSATGLYAGDE